MVIKSTYRLTLSYLNGYTNKQCSVFHAVFDVIGYKYAFIIYPCSYFVNVYYLCANSTRTHTVRTAYQSWVVYLARCEVCGYPCNGFLFIFVSIKLGTPLIQAHFVGSFRPVALHCDSHSRQRVSFYLFSLL